MNKQDLEKYFQVYTEQISILIGVRAYWSLLHYIIIFPDICGALESPHGEASKKNYENWSKRFLEDSSLSAEEIYDIRCLLLHQGRTLGRKRYKNYKFGQPNLNGNSVHKHKMSDGSLILDVEKLTKEMQQALDKWFDEIVKNPNIVISKNVLKNINYLAQVESSNKSFGKDISGLNIVISASTSSNPPLSGSLGLTK